MDDSELKSILQKMENDIARNTRALYGHDGDAGIITTLEVIKEVVDEKIRNIERTLTWILGLLATLVGGGILAIIGLLLNHMMNSQ